MLVPRIQAYRDQFLMIRLCKDREMRNHRLSILLSKIEKEFDINPIKDIDNPVIAALYKDIRNEIIL